MKSPRVLVVGSINMDLVVRSRHLPRPGETLIAESSSEISGGKGANQAVAAARLGASVVMLGAVGDDSFAGRLLENLRSEAIDVSAVRRVKNCASGLAIVAVEDSGENAITVVPNSNYRLTPSDIDSSSDLIGAADIILLQLEIPMETVLRTIEIAKRLGRPVLLDPAPAPSHFASELLGVNFLCPNQSEAAAILGEPCDSVERSLLASKKLHELGVEHAMVTLGKDGVAYCGPERGPVHIPSIETTAVDTTAAGDSFAGAFAVSFVEGFSVVESISRACVAGALTASKHGAQPALPSRTIWLESIEANQSAVDH